MFFFHKYGNDKNPFSFWAFCTKIQPLLLNYPIFFVPGSVCCSSGLCLFHFNLKAVIIIDSIFKHALLLLVWRMENIIKDMSFIIFSIFQMVKVERLAQKLQIMSFIGNFYDNMHQLQPVRYLSVCQELVKDIIFLHCEHVGIL